MSSPKRHRSHDPQQHDHAHGENCGHQRVHHDDHLDYPYNGRWHTAHEGHYDKHAKPGPLHPGTTRFQGHRGSGPYTRTPAEVTIAPRPATAMITPMTITA